MKMERFARLSCCALAGFGVMAFGSSAAFAQAAPVATSYGTSLDEDAQIAAPLRAVDGATMQPTTADPSCPNPAPNDCIVVRPQNGTLTGTAPNYTYKPNADFYGTDSFEFYVAKSGVLSTSTATATFTVNPRPDAPEFSPAGDLQVMMNEDTTTTINLTARDPDDLDPNNPPEITLTYTIAAQPTKGTLGGSGSTLTYTPNMNFQGTDTFRVTVADPEGNTDNQTVRITVNGVNDVPMVMNQTVNVGEDMSTNIFLMAEDVDGDPLTYTIVDMPTNGTVSGNGNSVTYTPTMNFTGTDRFTWRANDGNGGMSALATVDIVIGNANDAPVFSGATPADGDVVAGNEGDTISFTLEAMDADMDPLIFSVMGLADLDGATFDMGTGVFNWATNYKDVGEYDLIIRVSDGANDVNRSIKVRVNRLDSDSDGLSDTLELELGTSPTNPDSDGDTISDRDEINIQTETAVDTNMNGLIDALDTDSDGDGVADRDEVTDTDIKTYPDDSDGDGIPNFQDPDSDGDGIDDKTDNCYDKKNPDQLDTDGDGMGDGCDDDLDNDGVLNIQDACPTVSAPGQISGCLPAEEPEPEGRCEQSSIARGAKLPAPLAALMLAMAGLLFGLRRRRD
ncbi:MAG: Ig-like domain-containing protein [Myxococcota bacterium]|nr:Ig-like domain-containing protein [Myxococcota bacterium]